MFLDFSDIDGLQRKLSRMLSVNEDETDHWEVIRIVFSCGITLACSGRLRIINVLGGRLPWNVVEV
jgi:hypothetical protein